MDGDALAQSPDPKLAELALSRVAENPEARDALSRSEVLAPATLLLGFSRSVTDFLVAHPEETASLADLHPRSRDELAAELRADVKARGSLAGLRVFRRRAMMRVGARDLMGAPLEAIVEEITNTAEVCLETTCREAWDGKGFAVLGLGKLGGAELNYASDVDVIFLHLSADLQEKAQGAAANLIRLLSEPTEEGLALRVDATLRPGGRGGALSRSLESSIAYYANEAATWERQSLIKARPVAGDVALGIEFLEAVAPFVYPEDLSSQAIDVVRQVKVRLEEYVRARGKEAIEVKRGRGGIRDVEFAVQLLQIVHGRRDERLREPNTLRALAALADEGYVAESDAEVLAGAYRFLRRLEHRLQIVRDLQTHELPAEPEARLRIARSLGLVGPDELQAEYDRQTELAREVHERLFYRPLLEAFAGARAPRPGVEREATEELLAGLGFAEPAGAYELLESLVDPATRMGKVLAHLFPVVVAPLALASKPDEALVRLVRILAAAHPDVADAMANDPAMARRLAHVAATSSFAADLLIAKPERALGLAGAEIPADPPAALASVAARYAAREFGTRETGRELARIAQGVIVSALEAAGPDLPFAVIGMGKLGAEELNFASDLDVVFVYEGDGPEDFTRAVEIGEAVLAGVREAGWEPDADLRPEGRSGPLARSLTAYFEYWEKYSENWEFQSLLRARFLAGDEDLGRRFEMNAADFAYGGQLTVDRVAEMLSMRERIEKERVRPPEAGKFHFKLGYGSLADVQFAVELSLIRHGHEHEGVRRKSTFEAIEALAEAGLLEESAAKALGDAFVFLNDVKNALEVDRRIHSEAIPPQVPEQRSLARRLGYEEYPRQSFIDDYLRITRRARQAMQRVFADAGAA
ncbi:MAG: hypothetical protein WD276_07805 [Actinomycetota bacterium]